MSLQVQIKSIKGAYIAINTFVRKYKLRIVVEIVFLAGLVFFSVIAAFLNKYAIDKVILGKDVHALYRFILIVLVLFFVALIWKFLATYWQAVTRQKFSIDLRKEIFLSLQKVPHNILANFLKPGEIVYRFLSDVSTLEDIVISFITQNLISLLYLVVIAFLLIKFHIVLGLIAVGSLVLYVGIFVCFRKKIMTISLKVKEFFEHLTGYITQYYFAQLEIRLLGGEETEQKRLDNLLKIQLALNIKSLVLGNYSSAVIETTATLWGLLLLGYGAWLVIQGNLTLGTLIAFLTLSGQLFTPLNRIIGLFLGFQPAVVSIGRVCQLLNLPKEKPFKTVTNGVKEEDFYVQKNTGIKIRLENFSFYHGNKPILDNVTCNIMARDRLYLVGPNGSGKSTFCKLLVGIYPPSKGKLYLMDKDVSSLSKKSLLKKVLLLTHDPYFFKGSLYDNLAYGVNPLPNQEEMLLALEKVRMTEFISNLPSGLQSVIADRGQNLSTGQKLRLHCARALLRKPAILILDEVFFGIEAEHLDSILEELSKDSALIITTTQLSLDNLKDGDRAYKLTQCELSPYQG